jgi:hypothetical protein
VVERLDTLDEEHDDKVESGADGSVVVERDERVHLRAIRRRSALLSENVVLRIVTHLHAVQQDLDHDQSRGLETEGQGLTDETSQDKVQFTVGG